MTRVSTRKLKDNLSNYLHRAEHGERIEVLRGGKPVAALVSLDAVRGDDEESRLRTLAARGRLLLPREGSNPPRSRSPLALARGSLASAMVIEDRR